MPYTRPVLPSRTLAGALAASLALPALALPSPAAAQSPVPSSAPSGVVGSRVRVHTAPLDGLPLTGVVESLGDDRIVLRLRGDGESIVLPASTVTRLEVARPHPSLERNVAIGGTLGALAGAGLYLSWCFSDRDACRRDRHDTAHGGELPVTAGALAVVGGALVGGGIVYLLTPQRWESLPLPVRLGAAPTARGGVVVGARLGR